MRLDNIAFEVDEAADPGTPPGTALADRRFRALLSQAEWAELPPAIRRRFSKHRCHGQASVYVGLVRETRMSRVGWLLAQAARLIGGPLPISRDAEVPGVVTVTEDVATGGQIWSRLYGRRNRFPQVIHSAKNFAGPTGLEEYVGFGVGMALTIHVRGGALVFRSDRYFLQIMGRRIVLPAWLSPGVMTVTHAERGHGRFVFTLEVVHPVFGALIRQTASFEEVTQ